MYKTKEKRKEYSKKYYQEHKQNNGPRCPFNELPIDDIITDYNNQITIYRICKKYNTYTSAIKRILIQQNIQLRHAPHYVKRGSENHKYKGYMGITGTIWGFIKLNATRRGLPFTITIEDAWNQFIKQEGMCALSGIELILASNKKEIKQKYWTASLDRIDSSQGYTVNNIQWIHKDINIMKNNYDNNYYIETCRRIARYNEH